MMNDDMTTPATVTPDEEAPVEAPAEAGATPAGEEAPAEQAAV